MLIGGIDLRQMQPRPWYRKPLADVSVPRINTQHNACFAQATSDTNNIS
jgi:hypothetical protein